MSLESENVPYRVDYNVTLKLVLGLSTNTESPRVVSATTSAPLERGATAKAFSKQRERPHAAIHRNRLFTLATQTHSPGFQALAEDSSNDGKVSARAERGGGGTWESRIHSIYAAGGSADGLRRKADSQIFECIFRSTERMVVYCPRWPENSASAERRRSSVPECIALSTKPGHKNSVRMHKTASPEGAKGSATYYNDIQRERIRRRGRTSGFVQARPMHMHIHTHTQSHPNGITGWQWLPVLRFCTRQSRFMCGSESLAVRFSFRHT